MTTSDQRTSLFGKNFLKLISFRIQIVLAYQMIAVVVGWHMYELTHDPLSLGLIGLAELIPYFCSTLFAGYLVDHYSRRVFALAACGVTSLTSIMLLLTTLDVLHGDPAWWIYAAVALVGMVRTFITPSYMALLALVLSRSQFARASGISSSAFQFGLVAGPALGGVLVGWAGKEVAYGVSALLAISAAFTFLTLKVKQPPLAQPSPVFASIGEGLRFVFNSRIVLSAQALDMFAVLFGGAVAMLPAYVQDIFHYGPEGLGILRAAPAVGSVLIGVILARFTINRHAGHLLLGSVAAFGVCIILFGISTNFWVAALLLFFSGLFDGVSIVMRTTILQLATPDNMRGRVSAINGIFIGSSNELGAFESGVAARLLGLVPSVVFGGAMTLAVVGAMAYLSPKLRKLDMQQLH